MWVNPLLPFFFFFNFKFFLGGIPLLTIFWGAWALGIYSLGFKPFPGLILGETLWVGGFSPLGFWEINWVAGVPLVLTQGRILRVFGGNLFFGWWGPLIFSGVLFFFFPLPF